MRNYLSGHLIFAAVGLVGGSLLWAGSAGAQAAPAGAQAAPARLTVVKEVDGTFPDDTTFTVAVICDLDEAGHDINVEITFDFQGDPQPAGSNQFPLLENDGVCRIKETATGGADTVNYACIDNAHAIDPAHSNGDLCEGLNQSGEFVVDYDVVAESGLTAAVTITNTPGLPATGSDSSRLLPIGAAIAGLGVALSLLVRRRRSIV